MALKLNIELHEYIFVLIPKLRKSFPDKKKAILSVFFVQILHDCRVTRSGIEYTDYMQYDFFKEKVSCTSCTPGIKDTRIITVVRMHIRYAYVLHKISCPRDFFWYLLVPIFFPDLQKKVFSLKIGSGIKNAVKVCESWLEANQSQNWFGFCSGGVTLSMRNTVFMSFTSIATVYVNLE